MSVSIGARPARAKAMSVSIGARPARAKAMSVSSEARPTRAKVTPVSRERFVMPAGYGGAWPRCRWAAAGPGRASRSTTPSRRLACGDLAGGRARRRPEHQRSRKQQAQSQITAAAAVGCGRARRRRGLAGLRDDAPSGARCADGSRAGRRPPAHTAAGPHKAARPHSRGLRHPEHQQHHVVEMGGIEPPSQRGVNCLPFLGHRN